MGTTVPRANCGLHLLPDDSHRPANDAQPGTAGLCAGHSNRHGRHACTCMRKVLVSAAQPLPQTRTAFPHPESHGRNHQGFEPVIGRLHPGSRPVFVGAGPS